MIATIFLSSAVYAADLSRTLDPNIGITPTTAAFDLNGGVQGIITSGSGTWYASSSVSWIKVTTVSGTAGYTVSYSVDAYNGVEKRTGIVYVSGREHTVTQTGTAATLASGSAEVDAAGGKRSVSVSATDGQTWHAQSNVDWIKLSSTSGTGSQTISFTVDAYDEVSTRRGTLTIADNTFTVYQTGRLMKLTSNSTEVDYLGETVKIRVNALADTAWSVSEDADWLTIADAGPGLGGGAVKIAVAENPSANARTAVVTIGTESFTIKQFGRTALVFKTDKSELSVGASGASSEILSVTATPDLGWTATANADWIIFSRSSGSGLGSVGFKVSANPTLMERRATVTVTASDSRVAVRKLEITQSAATAELTGSAYTFEAAGEAVLVGVSVDAIVGWTVQNPLSWLTVTGATGTGPATLTLSAAANTSVEPRSGILTIAGIEYSVTQKGQGVSLDVQAKAFDTDGRPTDGSTENVITVTAASGVAWTAVASDPTWIAVYVGKSGTGNGTIKYVIAPYVGSSEVREGTITVGDQIVRISQRPYRLSIEPNGQRVESNAGAGEIQVALDIDGVWEAIATEPWIQVISGYNSGTGNGKVLYEYTDNNTGKERVGKIVISGTEYTLTQQARQRVAIDASVSGHGGYVSGGGTYGVGEKVTLTAVAESGYIFTNWSLPSGTSTEPTLSVTVQTAGAYTANFTACPPTILKAENALAGVRLTWTNLAWASSYNIWRGTVTSRGAATKIAMVSAGGDCVYRDTTGTIDQQYWYWIEAVGLDDDTWSNGVAATRQRNTFAITYDNLRGTTHTNPASYTEGDTITFSVPSARRGFIFVGWSPSAIATETTGDVTVRAIWKQNEYVVSYDLNGGEGGVSNETFTYGFWKYLAGANVARDQYVLLGWSRERDGAVAFDNSESVKNLTAEDDGEVALYAKWRVAFTPVAPSLAATQDRLNEIVLSWNELAWATEYRLYRATTDAKPAATLATLSAGCRTFADVTAEPGVTYRYWLDAVCDEGTTSTGPVYGRRAASALDSAALAALGDETHSYAQYGVTAWAAQSGASRTGGSALRTGALAGGESNVLTTAVSGPGTLSFWWKSSGKGTFVATANGAVVAETSSTSWQQVTVEFLTNTTYNLAWQYAQGRGANPEADFGWISELSWTPAPVTVKMTFNANGGVCDTASRDYATGAAYGDFPTPTWKGHTFRGWFDAQTDGTQVEATTYVPLVNRTFWAHWSTNGYRVRFAANGGAGAMEDQSFIYGEAKALTACGFSRKGYVFAGWRRGGDAASTWGDGEVVSNLTAEYGAVVELVAQWSIVDYTISYADTKNCANSNPPTYTVTNEVTFAPLTAPAGWRFLGWSPAKIAKGSIGDTNVVAQWEQIKYVVDIDGVAESAAQGGCVYGQQVTASVPLSQTFGYTNLICRGWVGTGDVPANGTGTRCVFTVTQASSLRWVYETNYWVSVSAREVTSSTDAGGDGAAGVRALQAYEGGSVLLKDAAGAAITNELWAVAGTKLVAEATANEGWLFAGWRTVDANVSFASGVDGSVHFDAFETNASTGANASTCSFGVAAPVFFQAVFTQKVFTVTFDLGAHGTRAGGGALSQTVKWGESATALTVTSSKNYVFDGWDAAFDCVTSNMTVHAQYLSLMPYIGISVMEGCETMGKVSGGNKNVKKGSKASLRATANKGYAVEGWYNSLGERLTQEANYSAVAGYHDATYYAKFIETASDWASVDFKVPNEWTTSASIEPIAINAEGGSLPTVKVTGLPTGLKFTAKLVTTKKTIGTGKNRVTTLVTNALPNTIYGTPTKSGVYTIVASVTTAGKATASCSETVVVRKASEKVVKADVVLIDAIGIIASTEAVPGKVTGMGVYAEGKKVTLKATANKGYVFAGWYPVDAIVSIAPEGDEKILTDAFGTNASTCISRSASYTIDKMPANDLGLVAAFVTAECDKANIAAAVNGMALDDGSGKMPLLRETNIWTGVYLEWPVAASALSETTVKVAGLPSGLKFTAKPVTTKVTSGSGKSKVTTIVTNIAANTIYGAPSAASKTAKDKKTGAVSVTPSAVKVTVTTAGKSTQTYQINTTVDPLPAWAQGTFTGPSYGGDETNGLATVTIAASGKISAKQPVNGKSTSFAASYFDSYIADESAFYATLTAKVGKEVVTNELAVSPVEIALTETASVTNGVIEADLFDAWQYNWKAEPWKAIIKPLDKQTFMYVILSDGTIVDENDGGEGLAALPGDVTGADGVRSLPVDGTVVVGKVALKFAVSGVVTITGEFAIFDTEGDPVYKNKKLQTVKASGSSMLVPSAEGNLVFIYLAPNAVKKFAGHIRTMTIRVGVE